MRRHCVPSGWVGEHPPACRGHASANPVPSLRACGARPSGGWTIQGERPRGDCPGDNSKGGFSRRGGVSAPVWEGRMQARVWHDERGIGYRRAAYRAHALVKPGASSWACRARSFAWVFGKQRLPSRSHWRIRERRCSGEGCPPESPGIARATPIPMRNEARSLSL